MVYTAQEDAPRAEQVANSHMGQAQHLASLTSSHAQAKRQHKAAERSCWALPVSCGMAGTALFLPVQTNSTMLQ